MTGERIANFGPAEAAAADNAPGPEGINPNGENAGTFGHTGNVAVCQFAGHVLLDPEWFGSLPPLNGASSLQLREVQDAVAWMVQATGRNAVIATNEFDPMDAGKRRMLRLAIVKMVVNEALAPYQSLIDDQSERAKSTPSILRKIQRWANAHANGDPRHPLRVPGDLYGVMCRMRPEVTREQIWGILNRAQARIHAMDDAAAPDIALNGSPALTSGGNAASVNGYFDQKLRFHLMLSAEDVPVELMMLTAADHDRYQETHSAYKSNCKQPTTEQPS